MTKANVCSLILSMKTSNIEILEKSLFLFSQKGYTTTTVRDIAKEIGITQSSLYKHFESKEAILNAIFDEMKIRYDKESERLSLHIDGEREEDKELFGTIDGEKIANTVVKLIRFSMEETFVKNFRKLLTTLQFTDPKYAKLYSTRYGERMISYHEDLFKTFITKGLMKKEDPHALAIAYVAPIFFLLGIADREEDRKEECLNQIKEHVILFHSTYSEVKNEKI